MAKRKRRVRVQRQSRRSDEEFGRIGFGTNEEHTTLSNIPVQAQQASVVQMAKGQKRHNALVKKLYGDRSDDEKRLLKGLQHKNADKRYYILMDAILRLRVNMSTSDIVNLASQNGLRIFDVIDAMPSPEAQQTLRNALNNGKLSALDELKIAVGLATNVKGALKSPFLKPGNMQHVATLLNETDWNSEPPEDLAELLREDNNRVRDAIQKQSRRTYKFYVAFRHKYKDQDQQSDVDKKLVKVTELGAKLGQRMKIHLIKNKLDKEGMVSDVIEWANSVDSQTAAFAFFTGSPFLRTLEIAHDIYKLPQRDVDVMKQIVRDAAAIDDGVVAAGAMAATKYFNTIQSRLFPEEDNRLLLDTGSMQDRLKQLGKKDTLTPEEKREKANFTNRLKKVDTIKQVGQFWRMLGREITKHEVKKKRFRVHHRRLKAYIDGMSDETRYMFLKALLKPTEIAEAIASGDQRAVETLFENAKDRLRTLLGRAGLSERAITVIMTRFQMKGTMGENYRRLIKIVHDYDHKILHRTKTQHAHKVMDIISKMRGDEFRQLRSDTALLGKLSAQLSNKYRSRIGSIIGVSLDSAGLDTAQTPKQQSKTASDTAENSAAHWSEVLHQYIKGHTFRNVQKVWGIVYDAQQAASGGNFTLQQLSAHLKSTHRSSWDWLFNKGHGLINKMENNEPITVTERLQLARRGIKTHTSEIELILEQTSDEEVLTQWSNFLVFKNLWVDKQQLMTSIANNTNQDVKDSLQLRLDEVNNQIDNFVIDIDNKAYDLVHAELHSRLGKSERLGKMEAKIRKRIAEAMSKSESFKALVQSTGYTDQDVEMLGEQVQALSAIRLEDLSRKGIEWTSVSSLAVGRRVKFSQLVSGHRRLRKNVERVHQGGDNDGRFLAVTSSKLSEQQKQDRDTAIKSKLKNVKKQRGQYETIRAAFEAARSKYNNRVLKVVGILLAIAAAGVTGGLSAAGSLGAGALIGLINAATTIGSKLIETGIKAILQGGLDMTGPEIAHDIVKELFGAGIATATGALSFQFNDTFLKTLKDSKVLIDQVAAKVIDKAINNAIKDAATELFTGFTSGILTEQSSLQKWADGPGKAIADKLVSHVTSAGLVFLQTLGTKAMSGSLMDAFGEQKHKSESVEYQGPHLTNFTTKSIEIVEKEVYDPTIANAAKSIPFTDPYKAGKVAPGKLESNVGSRVMAFEQTLWKIRVVNQGLTDKREALNEAIEGAPPGNEGRLRQSRILAAQMGQHSNDRLLPLITKSEQLLGMLYNAAEDDKLTDTHADKINSIITNIEQLLETAFEKISNANREITEIGLLEEQRVELPNAPTGRPRSRSLKQSVRN